MGKKLTIKGHSTRGKDVIELLEMMGGHNGSNLLGNKSDSAYFITDSGNIGCRDTNHISTNYFTLEEFFEKYPFKVGDKVIDCYGNPVTIKSMSWHDRFESIVYDFKETEDILCAEDLEAVNDNHTKPSKMKNVLAELLEHIKTTPKEELEREFDEIKECSNVGPTIEEFMTFCECVNKKPKYPSTYDDCCDILNANEFVGHELMTNFPKLINARNAYWKIAGEQMGLDEPWKPKFGKYILFSIKFYLYQDSFVLHKGEYSDSDNCILVFPFEEMRDAFYENFKDLIEQCKELL